MFLITHVLEKIVLPCMHLCFILPENSSCFKRTILLADLT